MEPDRPPASSLPPLGPYLLACAVVALWIDFGTIHRDQHSDSILNVLISLYRWTPFVWEQDRFGMLVPLLATPVRNPLYNLLFQGFLATFAGLSAFFLLARYAIRSPSYPAVGAIGAASMLALTPAYYRFEYLIDTSYGIGFSLALWGLILIEPTRAGLWLRLLGSLILMGLAHWVNNSVALFLGPFVLFRWILGVWPTSGWLARPVRLQDLASRFWRAESARALAVLGTGYLVGQWLMEFGKYRPTDLSAMPMEEWPNSWWELIRAGWLAAWPPLWLAPLAAATVLAIAGLVRRGRPRPDPVGRASAAMMATAVLLWLLMGTRTWVQLNGYSFRYLFPSVLLGQAGVFGMAINFADRLPVGRKGRSIRAALAVLLMMASATLSYGFPSIGGVRRDIDRQCGALTDDLLAAGCTCLAGDYWTVWVSVFHVNLLLHERGDPRIFWGPDVPIRADFRLWEKTPMQGRLAAVPKGDQFGDHWLHTFRFYRVRELEALRTIRVLEPIPKEAPRPANLPPPPRPGLAPATPVR